MAMQHRYVGDVGDFGKYALLRRLRGLVDEASVGMGIIWCLFPNEGSNGDGRHIAYLDRADFRDLDEVLLMALKAIIQSGERRVSSVLSAGLLDSPIVSCHEPVLPPTPSSRVDRLSWRSAWIKDCFRATAGCDLVFFDPDNGLEASSVPKHHPKAGKYIYWDELIPFWNRGDALLIYHHLNRTATAAQQVQSLKHRFSTALVHAVALPLVFRRGSSRVFWLVHHGDALGREVERRASDFLNTGWSRHFRPLGWPGLDQAGTATE